ncbi:MAG: aspartate/glutamate racemase family protein [Spirochaetaceae bacterium]|nr:aspartate/glutamate racemase family protein [Spirochaetaceae bacterium]
MSRPVLFLDSGVGGLPYLEYFAKNNPATPLCYVADREGFPYGSKTKEALAARLIILVEQIIEKINPLLIVLACNTASISALDGLRAHFPSLIFVGTVPAVRPAVLASKTGAIGVLGTERTVKDDYITRLADETVCGHVYDSACGHTYGRACGSACVLYKRAAPELVEFVEKRFLDSKEEERLEAVRSIIDEFRSKGVDGIVLGCTHFLFLRNEFCALCAPDIKIYDSLEGVCRMAARSLPSAARSLPSAARSLPSAERNLPSAEQSLPPLVADAKGQGLPSAVANTKKLFVTGALPLEEIWERYAALFGLKAALL